jgi:hypothetical protein
MDKGNWFEQENAESAEFLSLFPPRPPVPKFFISVHLKYVVQFLGCGRLRWPFCAFLRKINRNAYPSTIYILQCDSSNQTQSRLVKVNPAIF